MPTCPRCHQSIDSQAVTCPYCRTALKAYGHPGIPLYRAEGETYLCDTCTYHEDDTCNYPQRPYAKECMLYHNRLQPTVTAPHRGSYRTHKFPPSWRGNEGWWMLLGLVAVSLLIALSNS
ncbi:zinc-ribbon domain-containing protein [Leptolyngbya sp. NK1-12]|uniref:Zinc-ribbon domain-containing protein n=1 Tax=Leptolyngbya sp. NK1-12 TaxID=2547451 RepID=A0AA97ALJ6_9CYAN|nr:zinc-ribbon domain-containing protein [Leptolyngbya sp. NK1-12]